MSKMTKYSIKIILIIATITIINISNLYSFLDMGLKFGIGLHNKSEPTYKTLPSGTQEPDGSKVSMEMYPAICAFLMLEFAEVKGFIINGVAGLQYIKFTNETLTSDVTPIQTTKIDANFISIPVLGKIVYKQYGAFFQTGPTLNTLMFGEEKDTYANLVNTNDVDETSKGSPQGFFVGWLMGLGWQMKFEKYKIGVLVEYNFNISFSRGDHLFDHQIQAGGFYNLF